MLPVIAAVQICEIALGNPLGAAGCFMSLALSGEAAASLWMPSVVSSCRHHRIFCRSGEKGLNETCGNSYTGTDPCSTPPLLLSLTETMNRLYGKPEQGHSQDLVPTVTVQHKLLQGCRRKRTQPYPAVTACPGKIRASPFSTTCSAERTHADIQCCCCSGRLHWECSCSL